MAKVLLCSDGREFMLVTTPYTKEQKDTIEAGMFDGVDEYELVGEMPEITDEFVPDVGLTDTSGFTMYAKGNQIKIVKGWRVGLEGASSEVDADGFSMVASGSAGELIDTPETFEGLVADAAEYEAENRE